jgi:hypothetical protein
LTLDIASRLLSQRDAMIVWRIHCLTQRLNLLHLNPFVVSDHVPPTLDPIMTAQDDITAALAQLDTATARVAGIVGSAASTAASLQATIDDLTAQLATGLTPAQTADAVAHLTAVVAQLNALGTPTP